MARTQSFPPWFVVRMLLGPSPAVRVALSYQTEYSSR